ncbi:MAG: hypothetical protein JXR68_05580 [Bacteroidales bacterium]|nr:hypothetical protein [Bacteroidales bacterium]
MKILKYFLFFVGTLIVLFLIFLAYAVLDDYKPDETVVLLEDQDAGVFNQQTFSIISWNIGYCGMDETIDFFYDGGTQARVSKQRTLTNISDIKNFIVGQASSTDFFLLQEVDVKAKRSYKTNQLDTLSKNLTGFNAFYGKNYDVFFIPVPISKPYGKVDAGIANFSKYQPSKVTRFQYPGNYSFPVNLFMLDRCFLENRYKLANGKELLIINLHNSAFDDGSLRAKQLEYLKTYIDNQYQNGNYLIIGGDWNQSPPDFKPAYKNYVDDTVTNSFIPKNFFNNDWKFVYANTGPTNRRSNIVYDKPTTPTTIIDFFLISPNVQVDTIELINLDFKNSDHNPVKATFSFKK